MTDHVERGDLGQVTEECRETKHHKCCGEVEIRSGRKNYKYYACACWCHKPKIKE